MFNRRKEIRQQMSEILLFIIFGKSVCHFLSSRKVHCARVKMPESGGKKSSCLSMEVMAYILGVVLILINLGKISFRIYIISNKQWALDKAELVDGLEEK